MNELTKEDKENAAEKLVDKIIEYRKTMKIKTISCKPVSFLEAAELCTPGMTGHMVSSLITLQEQGDKKDQIDFLDKHIGKIILIVIICMIPLIYYQVMK